MMTIAMTPEAQQLLERYLERARLSLRGTSIEADEVERDVRAHVEEALHDRTDPVRAGELDEVLGRLGAPDQWVPEDEVSSWQRFVGRLMTGDEDWRLTYACFALTLLGLITLPFGGFVLVIGAYFLARATLALAIQRGEDLGVRRWLVYPVLVFVGLAMIGMILVGPVAGFGGVYFDSIGHSNGFASYLTEGTASSPIAYGIAYTVGVAGFWWMIVSIVAAGLLNFTRALFVPLGNGLRRSHLLWFGLTGLLLIGIAGGVIAII